MRFRSLAALGRRLADALRDLAPIILVIAFFQVAVIREPFPDPAGVALGLVCDVLGLALFVQEMAAALPDYRRLCAGHAYDAVRAG